MKVSFDGIQEKMVTFEAAQDVQEGSWVKVGSTGTVAPCAAEGDVPVGVAHQIRDGICAVQTCGYMKAPCAAGVAVGFGLFACDGNQKLANNTSGRPGFILNVDAAAGVCGVLF